MKTFLESLYSDSEYLENAHNIRKMKGSGKELFYRLRFGDYRLGYEKKENEIILYRILHRKDIYRYFP